MKNQVLVKRYAQGLVQAVKDEGEFAAVRADLNAFLDLYARQDELRRALMNPFINAGAKTKILKDVLDRGGAGKKTGRLLQLLLDHKRFDLVKDIAEVLPEMWNEKLGILTFEIASVIPLTDAQKSRLRETIEAAEKRPVDLVFKIDPGIIGGLALRTGHIVYDVSIQGNLNQMREHIQQG
ncbi:MAG: ATP synthase F1 subunit delta [Candidatus Aminicenantales bacterium]|jgi:F-type H+-transporting ATPase subunit delta